MLWHLDVGLGKPKSVVSFVVLQLDVTLDVILDVIWALIACAKGPSGPGAQAHATKLCVPTRTYAPFRTDYYVVSPHITPTHAWASF